MKLDYCEDDYSRITLRSLYGLGYDELTQIKAYKLFLKEGYSDKTKSSSFRDEMNRNLENHRAFYRHINSTKTKMHRQNMNKPTNLEAQYNPDAPLVKMINLVVSIGVVKEMIVIDYLKGWFDNGVARPSAASLKTTRLRRHRSK